MGHVTRSC